MICEFPDPYPDELLYSVCARYKDLMRYPNSTTATEDFFGSNTSTAVIDLPNKLEHLIAALPPGHCYTVDDFINKNTMFPFYAPFLPSERAHLIRNDMHRMDNNKLLSRIGLLSSDLRRPKWLRFCPACVESDRWRFRETYWHRIHQAPGVEVCPRHSVFLETSSVQVGHSSNPKEAISAEGAVNVTRIRRLNLSDHLHNVLQVIAQNAEWIFGWHADFIDNKVLSMRYHNVLLSKRLAYYSGKIRLGKLTDLLIEHYSRRTLIDLKCDIKNPCRSWLLRLIYQDKLESLQHPLRHILLINFLGFTVESFFTSFKKYKPFGEGPWPCLNHSAHHYRQLTIKACRISDTKTNDKKPIGVFECECGFTYTRTGPDQTEDYLFSASASSVRSYGPVWEAALRKFWHDTSITLREAADKLGVEELTVKRRAIALGLPYPRNTPHSLRASGILLDRYKIVQRSAQEERDKRRREWLSIRKLYPQAGRADLLNIAGGLLHWLRRNDADWLETNMPSRQNPFPPLRQIDWQKVDSEIAKQVKEAAIRIKNFAPPPIRVSLQAVIREVKYKQKWRIERRRGKLPQTTKVLDSCLEPFEDFLLRKVVWAVECYRREGIKPSRSQFTERAGIRKRLAAIDARVQVAVNNAMANLALL